MKKRFFTTAVDLSLTVTSRKKILTSAVLLSIGGFASNANADLSNGSLGLQIEGNLNPACLYGGTYPSCTYGAFDVADAGSYFSMDGDPGGAIDGDLIMVLDGSAQSYNGNPVGAGSAYDESGSHVTMPWDFFGNKGTNVHNGLSVSAGDTVVDMSTWQVVWGEVPTINMGGDTGAGDTGVATLVCPGGTCEAGESFTLDYSAHVPVGDPSGFGGVLYELHLQGTIVSLPNNPPTANTDPFLASLAPLGTVQIDLASNVTDDLGAIVDYTSFLYTYTGSRSPAPTIVDDGSGVFSYTDNDGTDTGAGAPDTFTYTVADEWGARSLTYTVEVSVITGNIPPVAQSFTVTANKEEAIIVDVIANVSDTDGTVDETTVEIQAESGGTVTAIDALTGHVTFLPAIGVLGPAAASFEYRVMDDAGDFSNYATVTVNVNDPPVAGDTMVSVDRNSSVVVDVVSLATDSDGILDPTSVVATQGTYGATSVDIGNGQVTYTPTFDSVYLGVDQFTYTIKDDNGATSNSGTITVNIVNALPVAVDDITSIDTSVDASIDIDVTANDTDSDGTINTATVGIVTNPTDGIATVGGTGLITYTPNAGFVGSDTLQYTVNDNDSGVSNVATVNVTVSSGSDFCQNAPLSPDSCFLQFNPGNITPQVTPVLGDGSYFTMEVQPGVPSPTALVSQNGLQLNTTQLASTDPLLPNIDQPWLFFGNLGVHQTLSAAIVTSDDGAGNVTLDFSGWNVSWNFIPSIDLGSGLDNGVATMTCYTDDLISQTPGDCSAGNIYVIDYHATVPPGDPSGFGNVKYRLHLEGTVAASGVIFGPSVPPNTTDIQAIDSAGNTVTVEPGSTAVAAGNTTGTNLSAAETGVNDPLLNPNDGQQCLGGCVDFIVSGFTGDYVDVIFRLSTRIIEGAIYRKLIGGIWGGLDASGSDQLGSNAEVSGACTNDQFSPGLIAGNQCVFLRIYDGGPNDADGVKNGKIVDPSGVLIAGSPNVPAGSTSGCSISSRKVNLNDRADWLVVAGFIVWLGLIGLRRNQSIN